MRKTAWEMSCVMRKTVIHLFGAAGSGTSTIGRALSESMDAFFMDTDDYFWEKTDPPFTVKRAIPERLESLQKDVDGHDRVVLAGSLSGWGDPLIPRFTLAVRVETAAALRLERLRRRERGRFGSRIEPGGDMFETHQKFLAWAAAYEEGGPEMRSRRMHDEWQKRLSCPLIAVDGGLPVELSVEKILSAIAGEAEN